MRTFLSLTLATLLVSFGAFAQDPEPEPPSTVSLFADLSPSNVVPPVEGSDASGTAEIEISFGEAAGSTTFGTATFVINLQGVDAGEFTTLSIHQGPPGANGPQVLAVVLAGHSGGSISGQIQASGPTDMEALAAIAASPGDYYLNLATTSEPGGLLRGPLQDASDPNTKLDRLSSQISALDARLDALEEILVRVALALGIPPDSLPVAHGAAEGNSNDDNN
jgi:hypothetical protein